MIDKKHKGRSRRDLLKGSAAALAALSMPSFYIPKATASGAFRNDPTNQSTVKLGFTIPRVGPYAAEGVDQLRAFRLAIKHLNGEGDGGMLQTMSPISLKGVGILGKKVEFVSADTQSNATAARYAAKRMIERDEVIMLAGGSSSDVAVNLQSLAQDEGVVFMAGLTHSNDTTGKDRRRFGFRHMFNAHQSGLALAPVLSREFGTERQVYHLTSDYSWGWSCQKSISTAMDEAASWKTVKNVTTPLGLTDFSRYMADIAESGADTLVLNHYGQDMVHSLVQATEYGLRDKQVNGKDFQIVVPLFSRLMAQGAGDHIKGIMGSSNWYWKLTDEGSKAFVRSFGREYFYPPSQAAHTCYAQVMLYADAVERAGTFNPVEVIKALEDHEFDGLGNGPSRYRAEDHQVLKNALVVRGSQNPASRFDLLEIVEVVSRDVLDYSSDLFPGELGPYS